MLDSGSEDTYRRSEPRIGIGFISQFSNEWSVLVKKKVQCCQQSTESIHIAFGESVMRREINDSMLINEGKNEMLEDANENLCTYRPTWRKCNSR